MAERSKVEKFSISELANLRDELQVYRDDSWQAADVVGILRAEGTEANPATIRQAVSVTDAFNRLDEFASGKWTPCRQRSSR